MGNNGFSDSMAAAGEIFELFGISIVISLCFCMISSLFSLELNVIFFLTLLNFNVKILKILHIKCEKKH